MDILANAHIQIWGQQGGVSTLNEFVYGYGENLTDVNSGDVIQAWQTAAQAALLAATHSDWMLTHIEGVIYQKPPGISQFAQIVLVNLPGDKGAADCMPPYVTVKVIKFPDNAEKWPVGAKNFRRGFWGFAGISENDQDRGLLDPLAAPTWNALGEALESITVTDGVLGSIDLFAIMYRPQLETWSDTVPVAETEVDYRLGTRNSRKY